MYKVTWFDGVTRNYTTISEVQGCYGFDHDGSREDYVAIKSIEYFKKPVPKWEALPNSIFDRKQFARNIGDLSKDNQKITAIKLVRSVTGWGLKESKDFVDNL